MSKLLAISRAVHKVHPHSGRREWVAKNITIALIGSVSGTATGILSEMSTKLRDWAVCQGRSGCDSQAALSSNDSKTLYKRELVKKSIKFADVI